MINGIDSDADRAYAALGDLFNSGSLQDLYANRWGVVIGESLAESIGVETGDQLTIYSSAVSINPLVPLANFRAFDVVGTFRVGTKELDEAYVIINQPAARALFRLRSAQNALHLRLDDALAADQIVGELDSWVPRGSLLNPGPSNSVQFTTTSDFQEILWLLCSGFWYQSLRSI